MTVEENLLNDLRSGDYDRFILAVSVLRRLGQLRDGSLKNIDLSHSTLDGIDLSETIMAQIKMNSASLIGANFWKFDLTEANFQDAKLERSYFRSANLQGANFAGANLIGANLGEADLRYCNLQGANLLRANLSTCSLFLADLSNANLSQANLHGTNLINAKVINTEFAGAIFGKTILADIDLSQSKNIENIEHHDASSISIDTILQLNSPIPINFLRGCGIPEIFISYFPSLMGIAIEFYSCFISYSHEDKSFARRLHDTLQGRGIRCWLDEREMNPGDDIYHEVDEGIRYSGKFLLCCSQNSLKSWWVDNEIDSAFEKEREIMKHSGEKVLSLVPLDLDGFLFGDEYKSGKKQQIRSRLAADFRGWEHDNSIFEREIERVIKALRMDGGKVPPPASNF